MKNLFNLDFGAALRRVFGGDKKPEAQTVAAGADVMDKTAVSTAQSTEREAEAEQAIVLTIWTIARTRYAAARALCTDIEVFPSDAIVLCEDIHGYVFDTPSGESVVVEAGTGSLVGHSLEVVKDGIREMTMLQLKNQLDTARKEFNRMKKHELSNDEFWQAIKMGGAETDVAQDYQE